MDANSKTDELEHRMEIENTRLGVVEELGFQVAFLGCGWFGCALGSYWWLLAGLPLYFIIRRPYLKRQEAAESAWSDSINAVE